MNRRAEFLAWKRRQLLAESSAQREDLAQQIDAWSYRLQSVDTGLRILARIRQHPGWIAGAAAGLLLLTPRRLSSLLRLGVSGLRSWQSYAPTVRMLLERMR
ncbi:YqjK family protein [Noviherbaspirillum sp.]|uniref:YqjK family protein n=1 Tax=Noviherbaspirillum sp. TaxID=1926288 RepID=UPI002D3DAD7D|nr:YqjK family protein [Noviherbaspirillum sp.]HZW23014.1 YqjK family protein [Noviherbaspirillum sp.]